MKQYKYGVIGSFVTGKETYGGQSLKTKNFAIELEKVVGEDKVLRIDSYGWKKQPFKLFFNILKASVRSEEIVILPADRGVLVIPRIVSFLKVFCKIKLQYVVIGGWLPEFLKSRKGLTKCLKKFDGIYVETNTMKTALEADGFKNITVLPNFKRINIIQEEQLVYPEKEPYRLCTFSRVLKEKGIEDAANAVVEANNKLGRVAYCLDIFGRVEPAYEEEFAEFKKTFPEYIRYMGAADGSRSTEIVKDYFALLFPTHYYTEGIPGTIIDAYAAGVPVISSRWESFSDVVDDNKSGIGYEFANKDELLNTILQMAESPQVLIDMKKYCIQKAKEFTPENIIKIFCEK